MTIEDTIIFRGLNFLRIRQKDLFKYRWIYPSIFSSVILAVCLLRDVNSLAFDLMYLLELLSPMLVMLVPFYIAGLAAVATFKGVDKFDEAMPGNKAVLEIKKRGARQEIELSFRHFLSLLFGYCGILSFGLYISGALIRYFLETKIELFIYIEIALGFVYLLFLSQLLFLTLLGIYFLSDKIHRLSHE